VETRTTTPIVYSLLWDRRSYYKVRTKDVRNILMLEPDGQVIHSEGEQLDDLGVL